MTTTTVIDKVVTVLAELSPEQQREVLSFARRLAGKPEGIPARELLKLAGTLSADDARELEDTIESEFGLKSLHGR